ncbi:MULTISPECIES: hypothetical protein [Sulfolobaceae]|uniref:hypothetical protein n=1 Tax=Sulfolobaceae TaxID=118883 RepID=UPI0012EACBD9|nr:MULTISPECIES: hypothetical protein [unclassified Sulfolobus]
MNGVRASLGILSIEGFVFWLHYQFFTNGKLTLNEEEFRSPKTILEKERSLLVNFK